MNYTLAKGFAGIIVAITIVVMAGCDAPKQDDVSMQNNDAMQETETIDQGQETAMPSYTMEDIAYKVESAKPFNDIVTALEEAATKHKFMVVAKHDIQANLAKKGMELPPYTIVEVCNGKYAHAVLTEMREIGMFLPCRIAVYEADGKNTLVMMRPTLLSAMLPDADLGGIPQDVEKTLVAMMDEAAK